MNFAIRITIGAFILTAFPLAPTERLADAQEQTQDDLRGVPVRFRRAAHEAPLTADSRNAPYTSVASYAADEREPSRLAESDAPGHSTDGASVRKRSAPLPLAPPSQRGETSAGRGSSSGGFRAFTTTFGGLGVVLGGFLLVVWMLRRQLPAGPKRLPREVLEVLGKTTLGPRQELHLIRLGGKLVLIGASASQTQALAEVADADEVERITAACRQQPGGSVTASFREALQKLDAGDARRTRLRETADA